MGAEKELHARSESQGELCSAKENLDVYVVPSESDNSADQSILICSICSICSNQIEQPEKMDVNHWRCLNDSMWSQVSAVQVMAWRMLTRLRSEGWPQDMLYLDEDTLARAQVKDKAVVRAMRIIPNISIVTVRC